MCKLILNGPFKAIDYSPYPGRLRRWDAVTMLPQVDHLELLRMDYTYQALQPLGSMTQLAYLYFSTSRHHEHNEQLLDKHLMYLSGLTNCVAWTVTLDKS